MGTDDVSSVSLIYSLTYPIIIVAIQHRYFKVQTKDRPKYFRKKPLKSGYFATLRLEVSYPRISGFRRNKEILLTRGSRQLRASHWLCITNTAVICPPVSYINYRNKLVHPFYTFFF